jgi:rRNA processing protein Gar1
MDNIDYASGGEGASKQKEVGKKRLHSEKTTDDDDADMVYQTTGVDTLNSMDVVDCSSDGSVVEGSSSEEDSEDDDDEVEEEVEEEVCNDLAYIADLIGPIVAEVPHKSVEVLHSEDNEDDGEEDDDDEEASAGEDDVEMEADDESEDTSSTDESSSDEESVDELGEDGKKKRKQQAKMMMDMMTEEEAENLPSGPPRTKHEAVEEPILVPAIKRVTFPAADPSSSSAIPPSSSSSSSILPQHDRTSLTLIGEVMYHILHEHTIVVQAHHTVNPLNEKSLLCNQDGYVLGVIHEVFGPINTPFYIVRYPGKKSTTSNTASTDASSQNKQNANTNGNSKNKKNKKKKANNKSEHETAEAEVVAEAGTDKVLMEEEGADQEMKQTDGVTSTEPVQVDLEEETSKQTSQDPEQQVVEEDNEKQRTSKQEVEQEVEEEVIDYEGVFSVGSTVYAVPTHAIFITPGQIMMWKTKGSDASNAYDEEVNLTHRLQFPFPFFSSCFVVFRNSLQRMRSSIQTMSKNYWPNKQRID